MTPKSLAPYVLKLMTEYQRQGRLCSLDDLVQEIKVRRADIRRTVSALHHEGYVDALRMRPTLEGFAIGTALRNANLPDLRAVTQKRVAA